MKRILLLAMVAFQAYNANAQCKDWKWPEDRKTAEEKNVLYTDALNGKRFQAAQGPHMWLLQNVPQLNTAIYINGEKIYKGLIKETTDETRKAVLVDSLLMIYDMRIENCGQENDVLPRKAYQSYRANIKKKEKLEELLQMFDKSYELKGNDLPYFMLVPYMRVVQQNAQRIKNLDETQILERYENIIEATDYQIKKGDKNSPKVKAYKPKIEGMLVGLVDIDCDFVRENFGPKFKEKPDDIKLAKTIFKFMLDGKCTDDPLWLESGELILKNEPDYGIAKALGGKFKAAKDFGKAEKYFNMAIDLTDDPSNKADMYIQIGGMKGKVEARRMFRKALEVDPSKKGAYTAIGLLYFNSFDQCKAGKDKVVDYAVFLAAYDMFQLAGNTKYMKSAKDAFPSKEDVFTFNYEVGQKVSVGCWIGTETTIRTRD